MNERSVFLAALEIANQAERAAYLNQACAADPAVRRGVEELLAAHERSGSFMDRPAAGAATADYEPIAERPGTVIGPYKLKEQIGEGGMGLVFVAEQQESVRRKVALKIIKPGMDTKQVIARFEAERQALAMMEHQNIAKVFDAGTTESGRPYFVMELVHGVPITEYCDANKLTPRQRLELFVPVCQAIQHAHQKGIIHRDIKPSNVLVTMYDDKPVPKVIDFGVAKAIEQRLTEKSVYTQFGTLVGTFEYMSPEQAEMNAFGVDTRSDIYALGVLLYELLTGTTPLERQRLRGAAFDEIRRIIKEEEPQRPSVRLSTSGTLAKVAEARKTEPAKLSRLMRGELDWVVMKCLEKDRSRRYDTASGLARDVERYLKDEPVEARPPSSWYRFTKMVRRNQKALMVAGLLAAVVLVGAAAALWQAKLANEAEAARIADKDRHDRELADAIEKERRQYALDRAIEAALSGDLEKARNAIDAAEKAGVAPDQVHWLHGMVHYQQGKFEDAIREFDSSIAFKPSVAAYTMQGEAQFNAGLFSGSPERYFRTTNDDLASMTPETAEDYLCRGFTMRRFIELGRYKEGRFPKDQALADVDKAIEMRPTAIARAFRAIVALETAAREQDLQSVEIAVADIQKAKRQLADNKFVRFKSLLAHLTVAGMYFDTNQPDNRKRALDEAGRDAEELEGIHNLIYVKARLGYLFLSGSPEAALEELKRAASRPETSDLTALYALVLYEQGHDAQALSVLDDHLKLKPDDSAGQMLRIILWAEQSEVGPDQAFERFQKLVAGRKQSKGSGLMWNPYEFNALMLLGKKKETMSKNDSIPLFPGADYLAGDKSEAEYLQSAGKNPLQLATAHYLVGLVRLSNSDRAGAREHFQKMLDTRFGFHMFYPYARAYLARMKRDPEWPRWIQGKK